VQWNQEEKVGRSAHYCNAYGVDLRE